MSLPITLGSEDGVRAIGIPFYDQCRRRSRSAARVWWWFGCLLVGWHWRGIGLAGDPTKMVKNPNGQRDSLVYPTKLYDDGHALERTGRTVSYVSADRLSGSHAALKLATKVRLISAQCHMAKISNKHSFYSRIWNRLFSHYTCKNASIHYETLMEERQRRYLPSVKVPSWIEALLHM